MYNWSVDTTRLKQNKNDYQRFVLEQRINFGLNGKKLQKDQLKKHWDSLVIDQDKAAFLKTLLWPKGK